MSLRTRVKNAWNAFFSRSPTKAGYLGGGYSIRPDKFITTFGKTSIINSIYNRIAVDIANIGIRHVRVDKNSRYLEDINDPLNICLTESANIDQTGFSVMTDIVISLLEEGNIAIIPIDVDFKELPDSSETYTIIQGALSDIQSLRVAKIKEWYPRHVRVEAYDDQDGQKKELIYPKEDVCIVENPFYLAMNAQNSTAQRLSHKLSLLDQIDNKNGSDRLDLIVQLPYSARTKARQDLSKQRLEDLETQLSNSKLGIGYLEASEKIIQLNRPVENHIQEQIEYLTSLLFSQLGLTQEIMNGTASSEVMQNYQSRTLAPILKAISYEMTRKWLSQTARSQGQKIWFYQNAFDLVPVGEMAELVDKFTRNEIMTGNEIRQLLGMKPSDDPRADELRNKNLNASAEEISASKENIVEEEKQDEQA